MSKCQTLRISWVEGNTECMCNVGPNMDGTPLLKLWDRDGQSTGVIPPRIALEIGQKLVAVALAALEAKP